MVLFKIISGQFDHIENRDIQKSLYLTNKFMRCIAWHGYKVSPIYSSRMAERIISLVGSLPFPSIYADRSGICGLSSLILIVLVRTASS